MTASQKFINGFIIKHSKKIRSTVEWKAFRFFINADDLHSHLDLALARIYTKSAFDGTETHFWRYIHLALHNSAISIKKGTGRGLKHLKYPPIDIDEMPERDHAISQPDINQKLLVKRICAELPMTFRNDSWRVIWTEHFLNGLTYEEVAKKGNIPLGTVKSVIFQIRSRVNDSYGEDYKEAI